MPVTSTRSAFVALVVLAVAAAGAGCARPNPRLSKLTRVQGNTTTTTRFDYDDHAHPKEITSEVFGGTDVLDFTFDGGNVTKINVEHNRTIGGSSNDRTDLTYDGGRLTKLITDVGNSTTTNTTTLEYDDHNNLSTVTTDSTTDTKNHSTLTVSIEYGDKGLTRETIKSDLTIAGFNTTSTTANDVSYGDDGKPTKFTSDPDQGDTTVIDISYDKDHGNRLDKLDGTGGTISSARYDYDDQGRISGATLTQKDQKDAAVTLEYSDDADVADIDMTPSSISLVQLFDLRGEAFNTIDPRTQALRLSGFSW